MLSKLSLVADVNELDEKSERAERVSHGGGALGYWQ